MNTSMEIQFPGGRKVYSHYKGFTIKTDQKHFEQPPQFEFVTTQK